MLTVVLELRSVNYEIVDQRFAVDMEADLDEDNQPIARFWLSYLIV